MECGCAANQLLKVSKDMSNNSISSITTANLTMLETKSLKFFILSHPLPCSIVQSFETVVSTFAQQPRNEIFVVMTENILFVAELVSWDCMVTNL